MIRLVYNIINEIGEYDLIAISKHEPSRTNLANLRINVNPYYNSYLHGFDNIHNIADNPFNGPDSVELKNCYENPTRALDNLKTRLTNTQSDTFKLLCPYCLIINHSTFDHYIPKENQPVYSVLAKNLIPCCHLCNGKKMEYWREGDYRAIIHFYNDLVPQELFLHCDLNFNGIIPILSFRLNFPDGIDVAKQQLIERHFTRLDLINRYNEAAPKILSDIDTDFKSLEGITPTLIQARTFLNKKANELSMKCGANYWYAIGYRTLGASDQYINNLLD